MHSFPEAERHVRVTVQRFWSLAVATTGNAGKCPERDNGANKPKPLRPVAGRSAWKGGRRRFESVRGPCKSPASAEKRVAAVSTPHDVA